MKKPLKSEPLGQRLLKRGRISPEQLEQALEFGKTEDCRLCTALVRLKIIDEDELLEFMSRELSLPTVPLDEIEIDFEAAQKLPAEIAEQYLAFPFAKDGSRLHVAMADPSDLQQIDIIQFRSQSYVNLSIAKESQIRKAILTYLGRGEPDDPSFSPDNWEPPGGEWEPVPEPPEEDDAEAAKLADAPITVMLVDELLAKAIKKRASDIHLEPYEKYMRVRMRIDGELYEVRRHPVKMKAALTNRIKILAKLDIAERRRPQGGRIRRRFGKGKVMDFRVSIMPTHFGEKTVIRLLDKSNLELDMSKLGFEEKPLRDFKEAIYKPFGIVLVTGPTGSGKTTTLYSALSELNRTSVNISTAEDPIEFDLPGINQVQMHEKLIDFASALREFLRQDPDIMMVGEIRDFETADIAMKAALTGHLVLSTLHTNNSAQTVNRLLYLGVEPFLLASAVNLIVAQRLVRRLCPECKVEVNPPVEALSTLGLNLEEIGSFVVYEPKGCTECGNTGFKGRVGLYEVMPIGDEIKELILSRASDFDLTREAIRLGMDTLRMAGIKKLKKGICTVDDVSRATA